MSEERPEPEPTAAPDPQPGPAAGADPAPQPLAEQQPDPAAAAAKQRAAHTRAVEAHRDAARAHARAAHDPHDGNRDAALEASKTALAAQSGRLSEDELAYRALDGAWSELSCGSMPARTAAHHGAAAAHRAAADAHERAAQA